MTVLLVLLTFAFFILLDYVIELRKERREQRVPSSRQPATELTPAYPATEPVWVAGYQLPEELHYHRGHTWARVLSDDTVVVGLDDFARKLIGPAKGIDLPERGSRLGQGSVGFRVTLNAKAVDFVSPVEGQVVELNPELERQATLATNDPYGRGWIMKIRSTDLAKNLRNLLSGSLARSWMEDARRRLDLQLMALSGSVLQDGGEPVADFARHLSADEWKRLTGEFFLT